MVPTCVELAGGSDGAHVCGGGRRWWWCPRVLQWHWQAVVVVPTCVAWQAVLVVPTCVAVEGGVVVVPTCVAVEGPGCGAHVCGSGGGAHVCGGGRRWWWCPRGW